MINSSQLTIIFVVIFLILHVNFKINTGSSDDSAAYVYLFGLPVLVISYLFLLLAGSNRKTALLLYAIYYFIGFLYMGIYNFHGLTIPSPFSNFQAFLFMLIMIPYWPWLIRNELK